MAEQHTIDAVDARILRALQRDSSRPVAELAATVGLSASACHRRVKLLEKAGVIAGYAAHLDRRTVGLGVEVFVEITLAEPSQAAMDSFEAAVDGSDAVLECVMTSGGADYLLRVAAQDLDDFERVHRNHLAQLPGVSCIEARFVLRTVRRWGGYPVAG